MENFIVIAVLAVVIGCAVLYIYRSKKRGESCIGCPYAKQCGGKCGCGGNDRSNPDK